MTLKVPISGRAALTLALAVAVSAGALAFGQPSAQAQAQAQSQSQSPTQAQLQAQSRNAVPAEVAVPGTGLGTSRSRLVLRFLTDSDFPPFNYLDEEGVLTGFNVDLARAICLETSSSCDIQYRPWEELLPALQRGEADAVIAGHVVSARALRLASFTERYFHTPGRFIGRRGVAVEATPVGLDGKRIAVAKDTAHEAFVRTFFRDSRVIAYSSPELAREALMAGTADVAFDDGVGVSFWLSGTASRECCEFKGGPYFEPRFFGDGLAIAVSRNDVDLRLTLNTALRRVRESGRLEELVQRYFPNRVY